MKKKDRIREGFPKHKNTLSCHSRLDRESRIHRYRDRDKMDSRFHGNDRMGHGWLRLVAVLTLVIFGVSCGSARHFTPSPSLSNVKALDKVKEKLPYKVALVIPSNIKKRKSVDQVLVRTKYYRKGDIKKRPVDIGVSTINLFENGLHEIFEEVVLVNKKEENLSKYSLVFEIEKLIAKVHDKQPWRHAVIIYDISAYSSSDTLKKSFSITAEGDYKAYGYRKPLDGITLFLNLGTLGLFGFIYEPSRDSWNLDASYAFEQAQERAFDSFISQLLEDRQFAAFVEKEKVRVASRCDLATSPVFSDQGAIIPNNLLDAGEKSEVVFKIANKGEGIGFDVRLKIKSSNSDTEIVDEYQVGDIPPGENKEVRLPITANLEIADGWEELYIETTEKRGYDAPPTRLKFQTARLERPNLSIASVEINDGRRGLAQGNDNGIPENEETLEIIAYINNDGQGPGRKVKLSLVDINSGIEIIQKSQELGTVNVGEQVKGKVAVRIPRTFADKRLEYRLKVVDIREGASRFVKQYAVNLNIRQPVLAYDYRIKDSGISGVSGNAKIENGERVALLITPRNTGSGTAEDVRLSIEPPYRISADRRSVSLGSLAANQTGEPVEFLLDIPRTYGDDSLTIPVRITQTDFEGVSNQISLPVRQVRPRLELAGFLVNGIESNTTVSKSQEAKVKVFIKNRGELTAEGVKVTISYDPSVISLEGSPDTITAGSLPPGETSDALSFPLFIKPRAQVGSLPIRFSITQADFNDASGLVQLAVKEQAVHQVVVKGEKRKSSLSYFQPIKTNFPPEIFISYPSPGEQLVDPEITLRFQVSDDKEVKRVKILVNGVDPSRRGLGGLTPSQGNKQWLKAGYPITLTEGTNTIQVIAYDNQEAQATKEVTVNYSKELKISRTFAIIIGIADYQHPGINDLLYTENDAAAFRDFLMTPQGGRVPPERIKYLAGQDATAPNIINAVAEWLPAQAYRKNDRVLLFFAGHGVTKINRGFFLAYNTNPENISGTSVRMNDIKEYLYEVEAKTKIFISDACHSEAAFDQKVAFGKRGSSMDGGFLIDQFSGEGQVTIVAAKAGEESIELEKYEHGLFTYHLLEGLKGAADSNGNKQVDIQELYRYVYTMVSEDAGKERHTQHPMIDSRVEGEIIMAIVP